MPKHKFQVGDLVRINKVMPPMMSHFTCDKDAIVTQYSHNECQKGNDWEHSYSLFIKGRGEVSWYHDLNLKLIKRNQMSLLTKWQSEKKVEEKQKSNLDWIFKNGKEVLESADGATVSALAKCLGCSNLWGSHGEGSVYYKNAMAVLKMAAPFLEKSDKAGWLAFSKTYKAARRTVLYGLKPK
jgi:hypothetical protein